MIREETLWAKCLSQDKSPFPSRGSWDDLAPTGPRSSAALPAHPKTQRVKSNNCCDRTANPNPLGNAAPSPPKPRCWDFPSLPNTCHFHVHQNICWKLVGKDGKAGKLLLSRNGPHGWSVGLWQGWASPGIPFGGQGKPLELCKFLHGSGMDTKSLCISTPLSWRFPTFLFLTGTSCREISQPHPGNPHGAMNPRRERG